MIPVQKHLRSSAGFTLVELAIVMIIIGLLIAGVLKGQALIQNARVTSTVAQLKAIDAATSTFKDTYNALPGDMVNPGGRLPSCAGACAAVGDGNGLIGVAPGAAPAGEAESYFPMLSAANLITGLQPGAVGDTAVNHNYPQAKIDSAVIIPGSRNAAQPFVGAIGTNGTNDGLYLTLNGTVAGADNAGLKPNEALRIDTKMDDGDPGAGDAVGAGANCGTAGAAPAAGLYTTTNNSDACTLYVRIQG